MLSMVFERMHKMDAYWGAFLDIFGDGGLVVGSHLFPRSDETPMVVKSRVVRKLEESDVVSALTPGQGFTLDFESALPEKLLNQVLNFVSHVEPRGASASYLVSTSFAMPVVAMGSTTGSGYVNAYGHVFPVGLVQLVLFAFAKNSRTRY
jgi:hypothetical protein